MTKPGYHQQCVLFKLPDSGTQNRQERVQWDRAGWERKAIPASHQVEPQNHKVLRLAVRVLAPGTGWREGSAGSTPRGTLWSEGGEGIRVWASPTARHSSEEIMLGARPTCRKL